MDVLNSRRTRACISLTAYRRNLLYFSEQGAPSLIAPVIKADGYGHGAIPLAKVAADLGCPYLCVGFLEEALQLRYAGVTLPILVFNYFAPETTPLFIQENLTATVYSGYQLEAIAPYIAGGKLRAHLKVDTGMSRLGVKPEEVERLIRRVWEIGNIELEGLYSHFATADDPDSDFARRQYEQFAALRRLYRSSIRYFHISNSAGAQYLSVDPFDFIRLGISSYGLDARNQKRPSELSPVLSWETILSHVKTIREGASISYGRTFIADRPMTIGTVAVGYADGYNRLLSNRGSVLVKGRRCPILGRVCMDQFMIDLSGIPAPEPGEKVTLLGFDGAEEISCEEIAALLSTINYEVTCLISKRVPRVYTEV
ncbi:MAG TPA: alanine racemase [Thermotogota bacterium]|nr:alanine racemase [Thermotogota bacterium]OQC31386.1 MAG: Alanine racemase [Thermotogota bacterium ADurb.Bin062]HNW46455.1 alanine racemase [Thermotogota bacterium]HNY81943.1 alanine racemase [Thermotogota bacterium]HOF24094.1 alanine racemase [Thermotogota bacterium]